MQEQLVLYELNSDIVPMCNRKGCIFYSPFASSKCFQCQEKERLEKMIK